ncbi:hypothetical protein N8I74_17460 [Chitiniphilus purpureus]|uniref:DUF2946 domain-containing protein n=1 Tax=Chitiniphilus purpureus TaxID=2981137 RepID=A0ABY6DL56_9NEIS|nr:hypothetical protein [Chitiniphilus sp. CD1]UXY15079.1 hypothetical protein N8I74_17460 [Chitiniphilus sp. CD1]
MPRPSARLAVLLCLLLLFAAGWRNLHAPPGLPADLAYCVAGQPAKRSTPQPPGSPCPDCLAAQAGLEQVPPAPQARALLVAAPAPVPRLVPPAPPFLVPARAQARAPPPAVPVSTAAFYTSNGNLS